MRSKYILLAILTLALVGVLFYLYGGSQVSSGQPPLQSLTPQTLAGIENAFNAAKNEVRVLLLLSPT